LTIQAACAAYSVTGGHPEPSASVTLAREKSRRDEASLGPVLTSQIAGGHPAPLAQEKGVDGGEAPLSPVLTSQVDGGNPVPLAKKKGNMTGEAPPQDKC
jgi:hypothetical protein